MSKPKQGPRILTFDIETWPMHAVIWSTGQQYVTIDQIKQDTSILSFAAKWMHEPVSKAIYMDVSNQRDYRDDKRIMKGLHKLLNEAEVVISQNGKAFDAKRVNARFAVHGLGPVSPFKHIDTCQLARKTFGFSSNKLAFLSETLNEKYKKLPHAKFPGRALWDACAARNPAAWAEMKKYNTHDVLATEELYTKLAPWGTGVNFAAYSDNLVFHCNCGSSLFKKEGFNKTKSGKFQQLSCIKCGAWSTDKSVNFMSDEKKASLKGKA